LYRCSWVLFDKKLFDVRIGVKPLEYLMYEGRNSVGRINEVFVKKQKCVKRVRKKCYVETCWKKMINRVGVKLTKDIEGIVNVENMGILVDCCRRLVILVLYEKMLVNWLEIVCLFVVCIKIW